MGAYHDWLFKVIERQETDGEALHAWRYLFRHIDPYPPGLRLAPLARPIGPDRTRPIVSAALQVELDASGAPSRATSLRAYDGEKIETASLENVDVAAAAIAKLAFRHARRGALLVFAGGARLAFHLILRWHAPGLVALGYTLQPLVSGADIRAIRVRKGNNTWWLCDLESMIGGIGNEMGGRTGPAELAGAGDVDDLVATRLRVCRLAEWHFSRNAVALRPTLGGTALATLRRSLPAEFAKFRPNPLLVAMCRAGHGYRGGYVYARRYKGELWQADMNRAYLSAFAQPLPWRAQFARYREGESEEGIWMTTVEGPGSLPLYASRWSTRECGFLRPSLWNGGTMVAILASAEFAGLRSLGYRLTPGFGFAYVGTWRACSFAESLTSELRAGRRDSELDRSQKALGVAAYGRLAMKRDFQSVMYSAEPPRGGWYPFVSTDGEILEGIWARPEHVYTSGQQVDVAAHISARVRGATYHAAATLMAAGATIISCDTDSVTSDWDTVAILGHDDASPGRWRTVAHDAAATVVGPRLSALDGRVVAAGLPGADPSLIEAAFAGERVELAGRRLHLPWLREQPWSDVVWEVKQRA